MDNNTPLNGGNPNEGQPLAQPTPEPIQDVVGQPAPEPAPQVEPTPEPIPQPTPMPEPQPAPMPEPDPTPEPQPQPAPTPLPEQPLQPNNDGPSFTDSNKNKKNNLATICAVIVFMLVAVAVGLFVFFGIRGGGEKTVTCTKSTTQMGIDLDVETNVYVKDGEISGGNIIVDVDLKTMSDTYKNYESEMVDSLTKTYESGCDDDCTFDYDYVEGDSVKYTMTYGKDGVDNIVRTFGSFEKLSAQEIADKVQKALEGSDVTCTQK